MADRRGAVEGAGEVDALVHDEGDGTYSKAVGAHLRVWNGAAWVRWDGSLSVGSLTVGKVDQGAAGAAAWPVSLASLPALPAGSAVIGHVIVDSGAVTATLAAETTKVIGTVNVAAGQTIAATGPVTDTQLRATPVPVSGTVNPTFPATGTVTSPGSVTTSVATVLASNAGRYGATVYNESGAICYLKLGAAASLTSYTLQVAIGGYYEVPNGYTGALTGITSSGTAVLRVTELTAQVPYYAPASTSVASGDLATMNTVPTTDETMTENSTTVVLWEYVLDATHELIFSDPSEMAVL